MIDLHIFPTTEHTAAAVQNNSNNNNNKNHHAALQPSIILTPASTTAQLAGGQRSHDGCRLGTLRPQSFALTYSSRDYPVSPVWTAALTRRVFVDTRNMFSSVIAIGPSSIRTAMKHLVASARRSGQEDFQRGIPPVSPASCSISPFFRACIFTE